MIIDLFDVGHGACAVVTAPNGRRLMIDCGHNNSPSWRPSLAFRGVQIEELVISNFDEDHVSDLPNVMSQVPIRFITTNTSVGADDLANLKMEYGAGPGIARLHAWMQSVAGRPGAGSPDYGEMRVRHYWNNYPSFDDENNLSIATVVEWAEFKMIFSGDLETQGWKQLLMQPTFANDLAGTNVFVASHHGRWTGCCPEVFQVSKPQIVIMSDRDKAFESQETTSWYQSRTEGINQDSSREKRHVYTTRCDGHMRIRVWKDQAGVGWWRIDPHSRLSVAS